MQIARAGAAGGGSSAASVLLEEQGKGADGHEDRADLHARGARATHLQQEGVLVLPAHFLRHLEEAEDRQDAPDDDEEVKQFVHVGTLSVLGVVARSELD